MKLTETKCQRAARKEKLYRLPDGRGLYLVVPPKGNKRWQFRYEFKKQNSLTFGLYPEVSLEEAREKREAARKLLLQGIDPSQERKRIKAEKGADKENTFEVVATNWLNTRIDNWSENHQISVRRDLEKLYPYIGTKPIKEIVYDDLLEGLLVIQSKGHNVTAKRTLQYANKVFRFAIKRGLTEKNIADVLSEDFTTPKTKHQPALTKPDEVGQLMLDIDSYKREIQIYQAMRFLAFTFVRTIEIRHAQWFEIDWENQQWMISVEKMKMGKKEKNQNSQDERDDHIVPLPRQAMEILHQMYAAFSEKVDFKGDEYIFPSIKKLGQPISKNTMNSLLHRLGYKGRHCTHGFRATARTLLDEQRGFRIDWIEHQLAHRVIDANGRAYNRTTYLPERRDMMQNYADYLDELKAKAKAKTKETEANTR